MKLRWEQLQEAKVFELWLKLQKENFISLNSAICSLMRE